MLGTTESKARHAIIESRIAQNDALIYVMHLERVVRRLREVAPALVAAAEAEVDAGWDR